MDGAQIKNSAIMTKNTVNNRSLNDKPLRNPGRGGCISVMIFFIPRIVAPTNSGHQPKRLRNLTILRVRSENSDAV